MATCKLCVPRITSIFVKKFDIIYICVEHLDRVDFDEDEFVPSISFKNGQSYPHIILYGNVNRIQRVWKMYHPIDDWNKEHILNDVNEVLLIEKIVESLNV